MLWLFNGWLLGMTITFPVGIQNKLMWVQTKYTWGNKDRWWCSAWINSLHNMIVIDNLVNFEGNCCEMFLSLLQIRQHNYSHHWMEYMCKEITNTQPIRVSMYTELWKRYFALLQISSVFFVFVCKSFISNKFLTQDNLIKYKILFLNQNALC